MLASLFTGPLLASFLSTALKAFEAYQNRNITKAQLEAQVKEAMFAALADVESAWADSYARSYGSFISGAKQSAILAYGWLAVVSTQLAVLLWFQVGLPALVFFTGYKWPSAGTTGDYAYFLLAALFGAGALIMKPRLSDWKSLV